MSCLSQHNISSVDDQIVLTETEALSPAELRRRIRVEKGFSLTATTANTCGIDCRGSVLGAMGRTFRSSDLESRFSRLRTHR